MYVTGYVYRAAKKKILTSARPRAHKRELVLAVYELLEDNDDDEMKKRTWLLILQVTGSSWPIEEALCM